MTTSVKRFLVCAGLSIPDNDVDKYGDIIRRGQRCTNFCRELAAGGSVNGNMEFNGISDEVMVNREETNQIYGPLFFSSIPDSM